MLHKMLRERPYGFYSLWSANHGYTVVQILANPYGITATFGTNSVRTIGSQSAIFSRLLSVLPMQLSNFISHQKKFIS